MAINKAIVPVPEKVPSYWTVKDFSYCNVSGNLNAVFLGHENKASKDAGDSQVSVISASFSGQDASDILAAESPINEICVKALGLPAFNGGTIVE